MMLTGARTISDITEDMVNSQIKSKIIHINNESKVDLR